MPKYQLFSYNEIAKWLKKALFMRHGAPHNKLLNTNILIIRRFCFTRVFSGLNFTDGQSDTNSRNAGPCKHQSCRKGKVLQQ